MPKVLSSSSSSETDSSHYDSKAYKHSTPNSRQKIEREIEKIKRKYQYNLIEFNEKDLEIGYQYSVTSNTKSVNRVTL